jgi:hypothetical protein
MQKVEVFQACLARTTGEDLAKVLWLNSQTSEMWLDRRTNYTRSLAVMCMVGYILGLGDRHPCNIMLSRDGHCLNIDFGDCFEGQKPTSSPLAHRRRRVHWTRWMGWRGVILFLLCVRVATWRLTVLCLLHSCHRLCLVCIFFFVVPVAMQREKFPEKIPFRLTRMLITAMVRNTVTLGSHGAGQRGIVRSTTISPFFLLCE